jgi:hypothetical protein
MDEHNGRIPFIRNWCLMFASVIIVNLPTINPPLEVPLLKYGQIYKIISRQNRNKK